MSSIVVRAPATTANLGSGFDCAAAALELWNELHVEHAAEGEPIVSVEGEGADEVPHDAEHLALRAFSLVTSPEGWRFHFVNRIPLERGLGSSAAAIAAGLVAGVAVSGRPLGPDELLELGLALEGHADNLATALRGGVCLIWSANGTGPRAARIATDLPLTPIAVVPDERVSTTASRARLPETVSHRDATAAAAQAALLGAAIASGNAELLAQSFHDRLHEPFRLADAPLLGRLRREAPTGTAGVTLSGSGPTVVVWARKPHGAAVAAEIQRRVSGVRVLPLKVAAQGAFA